MIINGPKATLGSEFNKVKNGSKTLAKNLDKYKIIDTNSPIIIPKKKAINVSYNVVKI